MEDSLKKGLKRLKAHESSISLLLGILVLMAIVLVLIQFFRDSNPEPQISAESAMTVSEDVALAILPGSDTAFELEVTEDAGTDPVQTASPVQVTTSEEELAPSLEISNEEIDQIGFADIMEQEVATVSDTAIVETDSGIGTAFVLGVTTIMTRLRNGMLPDTSTTSADLTEELNEDTVVTPIAMAETDSNSNETTTIENEQQPVGTSSPSLAEENIDEPGILDRIGNLFGSWFGTDEDSSIAVDVDVEDQVVENQLPTVHQVQSGEHLWSIAEQYYENGYNWVDIAEVNGVFTPDLIAVGMELSIPNVPARNEAGELPELRAQPDMVLVSASIEGGQQHTVNLGDTLWTLANQYYGNGLMWNKLYDANSDTIANPDVIVIGQQLRIPQT